MYCPRCSHEQKSKELKFCSKCGLPLEFISEVVETGQEPNKKDKTIEKKEFFTRRRGILFSILWFLFWLILVFPIIAIVLDGEEAGEVFVVLSSFSLIVGLVILVLAIFKKPKEVDKTEWEFNEQSKFETTPNAKALNSKEESASDYISPNTKISSYETNDLVEVGSITEETTKSLNKKV